MPEEMPLQTRPRVLIVDNEERTINLYTRLLNVWKYSVVVASGDGHSLLDDAMAKVRDFRCQIALVDMRLIDNFDEEDISGLDLIEKLKPAATIIVSGFGNVPLVLDILKNRGAEDFFEKSDDPGSLKIKLDTLSKKICAACKPLQIGPEHILASAKRTLFDSAVPADFHDQVHDALARLFPIAEKLRLEKLNASNISSDFSTVPRPKSVILRVYEDDLEPVIVKLARRAKVTKEIERFNKYIRGRLVGQYKPTLESHIELWDIGGIKLSYVGPIEQTFANFVTTQPIEKIEQSLEHFFTQTWSGHYAKATDQLNASLFNLYCDVWDRDWVQRANTYALPQPSHTMYPPFNNGAAIPNPLDWLKKISHAAGGLNDPSMVDTRIAVTHGDLHADNLLVDDSMHGWVMDFERTGEGHALQDFIELESDIITRIAFAREDFPAFYYFCLAIAGGDSIGDMLCGHPSFSSQETQKLLNTINAIRRLAVQCTHITDLRQYLLGLYFNTIFRATIISREQHQKSESQAWMLASILCHRLSHWSDELWPPEEWKNLHRAEGS